MRDKAFGTSDPGIAQYVNDLLNPEDEILSELRKRGLAAGLPGIQVGKLDARHLEVLCRAVRPKRAIEIGTLFGYSAWALLQGVDPDGGKLWSLESKAEHARVSRDSMAWALERYGQIHPDKRLARFEVIEERALVSLQLLEAEGPFDLVFIDADKGGYEAYWKWCQQNVRPGGVVLADNTFVWGQITKDVGEMSQPDVRAVEALRRFNAAVAADLGWKTTFWPTAEGLSMSVRLSR